MMSAFVAVLILYGNAKSLAGTPAVPAEWWPGLALGGALVVITLAWARLGPRLSRSELGFAREGALRAGAVGALTALAVSLPALVLLRFPPLLGEPVSYAPLRDIPLCALLLRAFLFMPLDTALPEELAFRGVLFAWLRRTGGPVRAVLLSSAAFALWHIVIVFATLDQTNLGAQPLFYVLGALGAFAATFAGGVVFALLRAHTGNLVAPIAAHWTFNAAILLGLGLPVR